MNKDDIIKELKEIKNQYKNEIAKIGIFGSLARGEETEDSDIDVVIEQKYPDLFLLGRIKIELEEKFKRSVDIIRLREKINPFLKERIERDSIYV
ncbi:MAG: nucleotidyltransferase domain-containing protein [Deltaproteobacteria bacterium]|nr:nucleotidyltransferase domain-containing protein [Deltaproteobacteria bacterium]MBW2067507.1 nucleotidyltransferase domain-containing protein [Deltaproteobacteria bacterium]